jgi:hypothetical protein
MRSWAAGGPKKMDVEACDGWLGFFSSPPFFSWYCFLFSCSILLRKTESCSGRFQAVFKTFANQDKKRRGGFLCTIQTKQNSL